MLRSRFGLAERSQSCILSSLHNQPLKLVFIDIAMSSVSETLENYSRQHPQEVLLVSLQIDDQTDEIMIFKGFSSSLMHPTAYDPDVSVIPAHSEVHHISVLKAPYQPSAPQFLHREITYKEFLTLST